MHADVMVGEARLAQRLLDLGHVAGYTLLFCIDWTDPLAAGCVSRFIDRRFLAMAAQAFRFIVRGIVVSRGTVRVVAGRAAEAVLVRGKTAAEEKGRSLGSE